MINNFTGNDKQIIDYFVQQCTNAGHVLKIQDDVINLRTIIVHQENPAAIPIGLAINLDLSTTAVELIKYLDYMLHGGRTIPFTNELIGIEISRGLTVDEVLKLLADRGITLE